MKISKSFRKSQIAIIKAAIANSRLDLPMPGLKNLRVRSTKSDKWEGWAMLEDDGGATITISRALKGAALFVCVAHEMTHISQYLRGDLESLDHKRFRWKNKVYKFSDKKLHNLTLKKYRKLPWEKEAYDYSEGLI